MSAGGPNSQFEKDFRKSFSSTKKAINEISDQIFIVIQKASLTASIKSIKAVERELEELYDELDRVYTKWVTTEVPKSYKKSVAEIGRQIRTMRGVVNTAQFSTQRLLRTNAARTTQANLVADALASYRTALSAGMDNMVRLTRLTQQQLLTESLFMEDVFKGVAEGNLDKGIRSATSQLYKSLQDAAVNQRFVQAGRYKYTPEYYAEMVGRVKFHEAQAYGCILQCRNYDTNLVLISDHNTTTEICEQFEGKIFSLDGIGKYPRLSQYPPFHPNCLHLMFPQFESALNL